MTPHQSASPTASPQGEALKEGPWWRSLGGIGRETAWNETYRIRKGAGRRG